MFQLIFVAMVGFSGIGLIRTVGKYMFDYFVYKASGALSENSPSTPIKPYQQRIKDISYIKDLPEEWQTLALDLLNSSSPYSLLLSYVFSYQYTHSGEEKKKVPAFELPLNKQLSPAQMQRFIELVCPEQVGKEYSGVYSYLDRYIRPSQTLKEALAQK